MQIKSPYNFAPAPNERDVFKPEWTDMVSHDLPFENGQSGAIDFTIIAASPLFVRNGQPRNEGNEQYPEFSHLADGNVMRYFIPGSSIKGMVRNVLEIMGYSRLSNVDGISKKDEVLYGLRDMKNDDYSKAEIRGVKSGWLRKVDGEYFIFPCAHYRIAIREVERHLAGNESLKDLSAVEKSEVVTGTALNQRRSFSFKEDLGNFVGKLYQFTNGTSEEEVEGRIVLYGDIDNKKYDYIFGKSSGKGIPVAGELYHKFKLLEEKRKDGSLLKFYKRNNITDIPVFFKVNDSNTRVLHFGFSKLYRLNDAKFLKEITPFSSYPQPDAAGYQPDLAELIFGYINKGKESKSLKGRVMFSHAFSKNATPAENETRILNSPKPSFYPAYLKQGDNTTTQVRRYKTYHSEDAESRGFKRYPMHNSIKEDDPTVGTDAMVANFTPVNEGAKFHGRMVYHNLKEEELGALLSALSFHNHAKDCFHSLGIAKPYGFGKIKIEIDFKKEEIQAMSAFEFAMNKHLNRTWTTSDSVKELFAMSQLPKDDTIDQLLQYPRLEPENEFNDYKDNKLVLENYSVRNNFSQTLLQSLLIDGNERLFKEREKQKIEKKKAYLEAKIRFEERKKVVLSHLKNSKAAVEKERLQKEEEAKVQKREKVAKMAELDIGINLNGVQPRKTIDGLSRTLKRWVEKINGTIEEPEIKEIKNRFTQLFEKIKKNEKQSWLDKLLKDLPKLEIYLSKDQIKNLEDHIKQLY